MSAKIILFLMAQLSVLVRCTPEIVKDIDILDEVNVVSDEKFFFGWFKSAKTFQNNLQQKEDFSEKKNTRKKFVNEHLRYKRNPTVPPNRDDINLYSWQSWSVCDIIDCNLNRIQSRQRRCFINGVESQDQVECNGELIQRRPCPNPCGNNIQRNWSTWQPWTSCTSSCGIGIRERRRLCGEQRVPLPADLEDLENQTTSNTTEQELFQGLNYSLCPGGVSMSLELELCENQEGCDYRWSEWSEWSECSASCGRGQEVSRRTCISGDCQGEPTRTQDCFSPPCWSTWSSVQGCWEECSHRPGYQFRHCIGISTFREEYRRCRGDYFRPAPCPGNNCASNPWSSWTRCSRSCGGGFKTRTKLCVVDPCNEPRNQTSSCNNFPCPYWSEWANFACCSVSCGEGLRVRSRTCVGSPHPSWCNGHDRETVPCTREPCNVTRTSVFGSFECGIMPEPTRTTTSPLLLKIIGGQEADVHEWPWQASWSHTDIGHLCGATLVTPQWLITAAHCIREFKYGFVDLDNPHDWRIITGVHNLPLANTRHRVSQVFVHPNYTFNGPTLADVALVKLSQPLNVSNSSRPICFGYIADPQPGDTCFVTGWGHTVSRNNAPFSPILLEAQVPILNFTQCQNLGPNYARHLTEQNHLCAGNSTSGLPDTCGGDSGGPLMCRRENNQWYLAGVTSFGFNPCGSPGNVGVYARLTSFQDWIRETIESYTDDVC